MSALPGNVPDARLHSALRKLGDAVVEVLDAYDQWWEAQAKKPEDQHPDYRAPRSGLSSRYHSLHVLRWLVDGGRAPSQSTVAAVMRVLRRDLGPRFADRVSEDRLDEIVPPTTEVFGDMAIMRQQARMAQPQPVQGLS